MKKEKRAPFKEKPIRYPGQSLDDEISKLRDKIDEIMIIPGGLFLLAFVE